MNKKPALIAALVGAVLSVEHIKLQSGRIAASTLVFERLHWAEVLATLQERELKSAAVAA